MSALIRSELVFAPLPTNNRFKDITGKEFGRYKVIGFLGSINSNGTWACECECGTIKPITTGQINAGYIKSCGCYKDENTSKRFKTHGMSDTPTYMSYRAAKARCENPNDSKYEYYGGRGIKFLYQSFEQFLADVGKRTSRKMTIDRIDANGHYGPGNCKWSTRREQAHNFRRCVSVTIEGVEVNLAKLYPKEFDVSNKHRAARRIRKFGWPPMAAIFAPSGRSIRKADAIAFVKGKTFKQLATAAGLIIPPAINAASNPRGIERKQDAA